MNEEDWQPVRIATNEIVLKRDSGHCPIPDGKAGKLLRVRPTDVTPACLADRSFEIHPDDRVITDGCKYICEHQILAD